MTPQLAARVTVSGRRIFNLLRPFLSSDMIWKGCFQFLISAALIFWSPKTSNISQQMSHASASQPKMSAKTKDILSKVRKMVPPMLEKFHKGLPSRLNRTGFRWSWPRDRSDGTGSSYRWQWRLHRCSLLLRHSERTSGSWHGILYDYTHFILLAKLTLPRATWFASPKLRR